MSLRAEVVGVGCRRHPRNEHGDDHHEQWESPDASIRLPKGPCAMPTRSAPSSRHFDGRDAGRGCLRSILCSATLPVRSGPGRARAPGAAAPSSSAGSPDLSTVGFVVTANTDSNRTVSHGPPGHRTRHRVGERAARLEGRAARSTPVLVGRHRDQPDADGGGGSSSDGIAPPARRGRPASAPRAERAPRASEVPARARQFRRRGSRLRAWVSSGG